MKRYFVIASLISVLFITVNSGIYAQLTDTLSKNHYYSEEILQSKYLPIYNSWILTRISGGIGGNGYEADFDRLKIDSIGIFKIFRNDSLFIYGKLNVLEQNDEQLFLEFVADTVTGDILFWDMKKYVQVSDHALDLYAPCCDRFGYGFVPDTLTPGDTVPPGINIISPVQDEFIFSNFSYPEVHIEINEPNLKQAQLSFNHGLTWSYFGTDTLFTDSTLSEGEYVLLVRAEDLAGNLAEDSVSFLYTHLDVEAIAAPWSLKATNVTVNSIDLDWEYNEAGECINWCYLIFVDSVLVDTSFSTSYTLTQCDRGMTYSIAVSAMASCYRGSTIHSERSDIIQVTTLYYPAGINDSFSESYGNLTVFPNPCYEQLFIEAEGNKEYQLQIMDLNGKIIWSKDPSPPFCQIDLSTFRKGVYFISVRSKDFVTIRKIVKL
ncbi:MAG: T9SS type A sorting domain-containing protein [Bacteroidales bacterium]